MNNIKLCRVCAAPFVVCGPKRYCSVVCCTTNARLRARKRYATNGDKKRDWARKWRAANRDKVRERNLKYRAANSEKERARRRKYYAANRDKVSEKNRKYRAANLDKVRERNREYWSNNRDKVREKLRKRYIEGAAAVRVIRALCNNQRMQPGRSSDRTTARKVLTLLEQQQ
jgi:hypothetical protein